MVSTLIVQSSLAICDLRGLAIREGSRIASQSVKHTRSLTGSSRDWYNWYELSALASCRGPFRYPQGTVLSAGLGAGRGSAESGAKSQMATAGANS